MWNSGNAYETFMGRWSRQMAPQFLTWLQAPPDRAWLDLGCGTGALSEAILASCRPAQLTGVDPTPAYLEIAQGRLAGRATLLPGSASAIPLPDQSLDIVVSGLALNFFPDLPAALLEIKRVLKPGGVPAAFVWDYGGNGMAFLQLFWQAANGLDPAARSQDEGGRYAICRPEALQSAFEAAGVEEVVTGHLVIDTVFRDFGDYWQPFLLGQGPAPVYLASLPEDRREALKAAVRQLLPVLPDGSIPLQARAIAVRGIRS